MTNNLMTNANLVKLLHDENKSLQNQLNSSSKTCHEKQKYITVRVAKLKFWEILGNSSKFFFYFQFGYSESQ